MIDLEKLRTAEKETIAALKRKDPEFDAELLRDMDIRLRTLKTDVEELRKQKNELAREGKSGVTQELKDRSISISKKLKIQEVELETVQEQFQALYVTCPNIPFDDVPSGGKSCNEVIRTHGEKKLYSFPVKNHLQLGEELGWFDFRVGGMITGSNFPFYQKDAVKLIYSLASFMLKNNIKYGFEPILPAALVNATSLEVSGVFPKFKEQVYHVTADDLYLTPTSEINLSNRYRDHIFSTHELPVRMTAWTNCFRREAGSYGATERGIIRIHQFDKVELYSICKPQDSADELERMVACAEDILKALGLHYRVSLLASQDCSFQSAKTYDIEVWLAGQGEYYEVSSASNCTDFQSRRGLIRYREKEGDRPKLVHTLNASSLALPRLIVAIMETFQQPDGSIAIPDILKKEGWF